MAFLQIAEDVKRLYVNCAATVLLSGRGGAGEEIERKHGHARASARGRAAAGRPGVPEFSALLWSLQELLVCQESLSSLCGIQSVCRGRLKETVWLVVSTFVASAVQSETQNCQVVKSAQVVRIPIHVPNLTSLSWPVLVFWGDAVTASCRRFAKFSRVRQDFCSGKDLVTCSRQCCCFSK
jgi:hypothetical protein